MGLGKRKNTKKQGEMFFTSADMPKSKGHPFYKKLNKILKQAKFDEQVEELAKPYYHEKRGRPSIPPGVYLRMLFIGFFEGIESEREIAWRCVDSLSLRDFLGYKLTESTPEHSTLSRTRQRLPIEFHHAGFSIILTLLAKNDMVKGNVIGIDASTIEANASMRTLIRRETKDDYEAFLTKMAAESGIETPTKDELLRFDRKRKNKKMSNDDWEHPQDPDAKIGKMKDGRTKMSHKIETAEDLETGAILDVELYPANDGDTSTGEKTLDAAIEELENLDEIEEFTFNGNIEVVADKGYHSGEVLKSFDRVGVLPCISEPDRGKRRWTNRKGVKSPEKAHEQKIVYKNRKRIRSKKGKALHRKRAEIVERSFHHILNDGKMRKTTLRRNENIKKRLLIHTAAFNLSLLLRKIIGTGKPRAFAAQICHFLCIILQLVTTFTPNIQRKSFIKQI